MAPSIQNELKISLPNANRTKSTLALSPTGDIQVVSGREKLTTQMVRAIVNRNVFTTGVLNVQAGSIRALKALITNIFRNFRARQVRYVNASDPDLDGYSIWRKAAGSDDDYIRVSNRTVTWQFTDTNLENGTEYLYGLTKIYKGTFETQFVDTFSITPSAFSKNQEWVIGTFASAIPGDQGAAIYVTYNHSFMATEILNKILEVDALQSNVDPRRWAIQIQVEDFNGSTVTVSSPDQHASLSGV